MKKIKLLLLLVVATLSISAQTPKLSDTISLSKSKIELFGNALEWFTNSFKSGKDVLQIADKESGKIIGKGFFESGRSIQITIVVKDNKYRYDVVIENKQTDTIEMKTRVSMPSTPNSATTYAILNFDADSVYITDVYYQGGWGKVYYNSENKPMITATSKSRFITWKEDVDREFNEIKKKSIIIRNQDIIEINNFIESLKIYMKKDTF